MKHSTNNLNCISADDEFKLLSYSDLSSLFQLVITLVHFVLNCISKTSEAKICFCPNYKIEKALEYYED